MGATYGLLLPASAPNARSVIVLGQYACQDESDCSLAKSRVHLRLLAHSVQTRSRSRTTSGSTCTILAASSLICRIRRESRSAESGHLLARTRSSAAPPTRRRAQCARPRQDGNRPARGGCCVCRRILATPGQAGGGSQVGYESSGSWWHLLADFT